MKYPQKPSNIVKPFESFIYISTNYAFFIHLRPGVEKASSKNNLLSDQSNSSESKFIHKQSLRGIFFELNENNIYKCRLVFSETVSFSS